MINESDSSIKDYFDKIVKLQNYAVEIRYPNETIFLSDDKVLEAIETAKSIRKIICGKINIQIDYHEIIDKILPNYLNPT